MGNINTISMRVYENEEDQRKITGERIKGLIKENHDTTKGVAEEVLKISRKTLESYERGDNFPPVWVLLKLRERYDCELDYLLGLQDHKKKVIGSVTDITGLREEVVESLAQEAEYKKTHMELGFDEDELGADKFLEYFILNRPIELLRRIRNEDEYTKIARRYRKNSKSYQIAKDAYEVILEMKPTEDPVLRLFDKDYPKYTFLEEYFVTVLAERLQLNEEDVDKWVKNEFDVGTDFLFSLFEVEQARAERIRVIEDCFTDLVKDYLKEVEKDAEK